MLSRALDRLPIRSHWRSNPSAKRTTLFTLRERPSLGERKYAVYFYGFRANTDGSEKERKGAKRSDGERISPFPGAIRSEKEQCLPSRAFVAPFRPFSLPGCAGGGRWGLLRLGSMPAIQVGPAKTAERSAADRDPEFDNGPRKPLTASSTPWIPRRWLVPLLAAHQTAESRRSVSPVFVHAEPSACSGHPRQPETTRGCLQLNGCHAGPPTEPARQGCRAEPDQLQHIIPQPDPCPQPDFPNVREVAGGNGQGMEQLQQRRNGGDTATVAVTAPAATVSVPGAAGRFLWMAVDHGPLPVLARPGGHLPQLKFTAVNARAGIQLRTFERI